MKIILDKTSKRYIDLAEKSLKLGLLFDDSQPFTSKIDPTTGFLTSNVKLARTGVQQYLGFELGLEDRAFEKIGVLRAPEEVFHPDSIKSFINLVVVDDHPIDLVTTDNVKKLQKGQVSEVTPFKNLLKGVITITDKKQIKKIQDGKKEVSVGYSNDLKKISGTFEGVDYEFAQTNIRANHLAIVDAGRCGSACKLTTDNKKEKTIMKLVTLDGIQFQVEDDNLAQSIEKAIDTRDAENEELKEKLKKAEEDKEEAEAKKDKAEAEKDAMKKEKVSDEQLNQMVSDRAALISRAREILGDKMVDCMDCPKEMKVAVIDHVLSDMDLENKSDSYIDAAYDMAIKKAQKSKDSLKNLQDDILKDKDGKEITRDSARSNYMKTHLQIVE